MTPPTTIQVFEESIDLTLPSTCVKMLIAQPYLEFEQPLQEPFKLISACRSRMLSGIANVFAVSNAFQPHVILFPEFTLPGVEAVELLKTTLTSAANAHPLVVIGGVHGLTRDEYAALCSLSGIDVHVDPTNAVAEVGQTEWVNTSITFIRDNGGHLSLWLQPKLSPSWPETNTPHQSMFRGTAVRIFRARFDNGVPCRFFSLLCFDWIGQECGAPVPETVLEQFNEVCQGTGSPQSVHFAFVLQHNRSPNHLTFLTAANRFLTQASDYPFVQRDNAAIIMACTAGGLAPGQNSFYGYSSLIFSPRAPFETRLCQPSFSTTLRQKVSDALGNCKDVVFREMGECIHGIAVRIPTYVVPNSTDRTAPLELAEVFPFNPPIDDPRIPGASVSAVIKWTNDELDVIPDLATSYFQGQELDTPVRNAHQAVISSYRRLPSQDLAQKVHCATAARVLELARDCDPASDADDWNTRERTGLRHVMHSLTLIGSVASIDAASSPLHARHTANGVEIATICGTSHALCMRALTAIAQRTYSPILFVSRDDNNMEQLPRELESFVDPRQGAGVKFTDSHTLLARARTATTEQYREFITELFNVADRRII